MKVALIHDHLLQHGGAERVLEVLSDLFPQAPICTIAYNPSRFPAFAQRDVRPSKLSALPFFGRHIRLLVPLIPYAVESFDLKDFDVVISSSSGFAKGVITHPHSLHICYCHTPTRYLWSDTISYVENLRVPRFVKILLPIFLSFLRLWDRLSADRVDVWVANSQTVAERIRKYYGKQSTVLYPPVDTDRFSISHAPKKYYLAGGRLVSYKRFDIIVDAFNKIGTPLIIFGSGPEERSLRKRAGSNITFVGRVSDERRAELYRDAIAFIHPQEEDFGITPVESMAAGRPVIALRKGGATETVIEGVTGTLFDEQSVEELMDTVLRFQEKSFDPEKIRAHAEHFSVRAFRKSFYALVEEAWGRHNHYTLGNP